MSVMLYYAATKTVGVADLAQDEVVRPSTEKAESVPVKFLTDGGKKG